MRNEIFGTHYELGYNGGESIAKIAAKVADLTEKAIVDEIVRAARAAGVTDLYLMDRDFLLSAIQEKQKRMNAKVNEGNASSMSNEALIVELRDRAQGLEFSLRWLILEAVRRLEMTGREAEKNEPLTLDELRQMDGEPVWTKTIGLDRTGRWEIITCETVCACPLDQKLRSVTWAGDVEWYPLETYGKTWVAYRHKPEEVQA